MAALAAVAGCHAMAAGPAPGGYPKDPQDDAATLESEIGYGSLPAGGYAWSRRQAFQVYFPAGTILGRGLFGGLRGELHDRARVRAPGAASAPFPGRASFLTGGEIVKTASQASFALADIGYFGDGRGPWARGLGCELIYGHEFILGPAFTWGLGVDLIGFGEEWTPYPLLFFEWWASGRTKVRINGDVAEVRQFISRNLCLTLGARYALAYGALGDSVRFESQSAGLEAGTEISLGRDWYVRIKAKECLWGEDTYAFASGNESRIPLRQYRSLRLLVAYAL